MIIASRHGAADVASDGLCSVVAATNFSFMRAAGGNGLGMGCIRVHGFALQRSIADLRMLWQALVVKNAEDAVVRRAQISEGMGGKLPTFDQLALLNVGRHSATLRHAAPTVVESA
jgi:hypothetical protein